MRSLKELQPILDPALEELGLTESEKKLYLLSLSLGPTPIAAFAGHLGISRPNVYKVIAGLETHGLAAFSDKASRTRKFVVEPPHALLKRLKEKRERMEQVDRGVLGALPDLLALYQQADDATSLKVYDTKQAWVDAFFQVLDETEGEYLFFGNVEKFLAFAPSVQQRWVEERVRKGVKGRLLALPSPALDMKRRQDSEELRETRVLPDMPPFDASFLIFGKKVVIWQPRAPLAILVEDDSVVKMLRSVFETLWGRGA